VPCAANPKRAPRRTWMAPRRRRNAVVRGVGLCCWSLCKKVNPRPHC